MKKILTLFISLVALIAPAGPTNLLSLTYVNGTNYGNVTWVSNVYVPKERFIMQSLGITNGGYSGSYTTNGITNAITVYLQVSVDGSNTNWITLTSWKPSHTNAVVEAVNDEFDRIALALRAQIVTTNALGVSVFKQ
jgi:hypothetical protein